MTYATEHQHQAALFKWAKLNEKRHPELRLMFAIPNGGHRHKATAAKLKAEGVKRGVPDICLPVARKGAHSLYIELKRPKGRTSPDQKEMITALNKQGHKAIICHGWKSAKTEIENYLERQNQ